MLPGLRKPDEVGQKLRVVVRAETAPYRHMHRERAAKYRDTTAKVSGISTTHHPNQD